MNVTIIYDNYTIDSTFISGWGFAAVIEGKVLFDTGEAGASLLSNLAAADIDTMGIEQIVLSHDHWDHTGGLPDFLKRHPGIPVWVVSGFGGTTKEIIRSRGELKIADGPVQLIPGVHTTGAMRGEHGGAPIEEQGILLHGNQGASLITGCAHPGIKQMAEQAKGLAPAVAPYACLGGFHLQEYGQAEIKTIFSNIRKLGFRKLFPTHCSGEIACNMGDESLGAGSNLQL